jgi:hypothetical protein
MRPFRSNLNASELSSELSSEHPLKASEQRANRVRRVRWRFAARFAGKFAGGSLESSQD